MRLIVLSSRFSTGQPQLGCGYSEGVRQLVVGAIIVDDLHHPQLVLAARRSRSLAGGWEFPGGKVEPGETPEAALVREVMEEIHVEVALGEELKPAVGQCWPINETYEMRLWFATITSGDPRPGHDHDELLWLSADTLNSVPWLPADLEILEFIFQPRS